MVSVTQYVVLTILKRFLIYSLDYKLFHFVGFAVCFSLLNGCDLSDPLASRCCAMCCMDSQIACDWNLVALFG